MKEYLAAYSCANALLSANQYGAAEHQFRIAIGAAPDSADAYSMLAVCLLCQDKLKEAEEVSRRAVELEPDDPFTHSTLAQTLSRRNKPREALAAAQRAIELDASDDHSWWVLAAVHLPENRLKEALEAAERGLALEPSDENLISLRDTALARMGRAGSVETLRHTLSQNPDSADAHTNLGVALLAAGKPKEAVEHFREALRIEPDNEFARESIVEAMKARSWIYRPVVKYTQLLQRMTVPQQLLFTGGVVAMIMISRRLMTAYPDYATLIQVFRSIFFVICAFLLFTEPLYNLVLRSDPIGRYALTPRKSRLAVALAILLLGAAISIVISIITGERNATRAALMFFAAAGSVAILTDIKSRRLQRLCNYVFIATAIAAVVLTVNYFVIPFGGKWPFEIYMFVSLIFPLGIWAWQSFATNDE